LMDELMRDLAVGVFNSMNWGHPLA